MATPVQVGQLAVGDRIMLVQFNIPASAPANSTITGTIYPYGIDDGTNFTAFQVPEGIKYSLVDLYVNSAPTIDGQLSFYVNGFKQGENFFLSSIVVGNTSRSKPSQPIVLGPGATFTIKLTTLSANGTTAVTQNVILHFLAFPSGQ